MRTLLLALSVVVFFLPARAQEVDVARHPDGLMARYAAPLAEPGKRIDPSRFLERTTLHKVLPAEQAALAFSVRLPSHWIEKPVRALGQGETLAPLALHLSPAQPGGRSRFAVDSAQLPYLMTAAQWVLREALVNSYTLQGLEGNPDGRSARARWVVFEDGAAYLVQAQACISGDRIVLARYALPIERQEAELPLQATVMESFALTDPADEPLAEPVRTHLFLDVAQMRYPGSWRLAAPPVRSIDRMTADLFNITASDTLDGQMRVVILSRYAGTTLPEEIERLRANLAEKGLSFGAKMEQRADMAYPDGMNLAVTEVYAATSTDSPLVPHELWFSVASQGDYTYLATLLTPGRGEDYFVWARNVEAFKLLVASLGPQEAR